MSASPSRARMEGSAWILLMASFVIAYQVIQVMLVKGVAEIRSFWLTNAELLCYCLAAGLDSSPG